MSSSAGCVNKERLGVLDKGAMTQGSTILTTIFIVLAVGEEKIKMFALRSLPITF